MVGNLQYYHDSPNFMQGVKPNDDLNTCIALNKDMAVPTLDLFL